MSWLNCAGISIQARSMQKNWERGGGGGGGGGRGAKWMGGCKGGGPPLATTRGYGGAL